MCGIVGYTHVSRRLPEGVLANGLRGLTHRGPDRQDSFSTPNVSLGAARLRVIDLAGGEQPMRSQDGDCTIVYNGEIYNFMELRSELEQMGRRFVSRSDTEVLLSAYLEWGNDCFRRLRGMFAVAIWKESERRLVLARDRMGIKPLYYRIQDGEIFFGSELKCIFAHPEVPRRIDLNGLNCFLSLNYVPGPYTLIEGITKLMPGCLLEWQDKKVTVNSYLRPASPASPPRSLDEACEELDGLLKRSIAEQLVADVPVGIWLSGGLDSSTLLHYAMQAGGRNLKTFSITFQGKSFDESRYVKEITEHYGVEHKELDLNEGMDLPEVIAELGYYSDEPSADAGAVPIWYLAKMTRRDVTVALSGEGSDELFCGYLTYKADCYRRIAARMPRPTLRAALGLARTLPASDEKIGFEYKLQRFLQGSLLSAEAAHVFWDGAFTEEEKRRIFRYADAAPLGGVLRQMQPGRTIERFLDFDQRYALPDRLLYKVDRISMAHSIEVRPPYLDDRIVDFAARLPESFKLRGVQTKVVLRTLMRRTLPPAILQRPKEGFDIPIHEWFRGVLNPLLRETLSRETIQQTGLFHADAVERLIQEHMERKANWGYHLWGLFMLILWMKRWKVEPVQERNTEAERLEPALAEDSSSS
ncbi:MAG: asparagine synthase (glutamine-hydrolyzing) [Terracidiphilus sp.]